MNKERLGNFISGERRNLGLTQRDLAAALHVTDKAVSKWERGLSYPDVTLLEPLAQELDLTVEELMACRRQAVAEQKGAEETMRNLLDISRDSVRKERRRSWKRIAAVLVLLAVTAAVVAWTKIMVPEDGYYSIILKETVNGRNYIYVEDRGHLIRLKCGDDVDFGALTLRDERGDTISYKMDYQWNRLTRTGTVSACEDTGVTVLGSTMDATFEGDSGSVPLLFGYTSVQYLRDGYYPDPYAESENLVFLCDVRYWPYDPEEPDPTGVNTRAILEVEDCINAEALDVDGDGEPEVAVRTRWPEKPYTVYDYVDGEIVESWPDTLPEEILEQLRAPWEGL
ncbi:helix-turn-helix transcriptional regulator [uncultured Oscillibacter sp.]|uniref:helix-turn-helix domain-containing protein n=1 Tax=uncultured Oscillibacter sp. TaxID=876091 RepID=UPI002805CE8D|nr:helix-turn-helix transcriptional regulator [uncultured Oscillibacter sp.]